MLDNFGELSGGDGWLSRSDLAQKSDGGDHDLLLNATDLAASASAAKTPDTQYVARKSTKEVAQDAAEAGKESSSKASAPNAKAPDMWREWLNRFFQLLFAMW